PPPVLPLFPYTTLFRSINWGICPATSELSAIMPAWLPSAVVTRSIPKETPAAAPKAKRARVAMTIVDILVERKSRLQNSRAKNRSEEHTSELQSQSNLV